MPACDCQDEACPECCEHQDLDRGFCLDCGKEVDWVDRLFTGDD